jgi:hypothetical protein
MSLIPLLSPGGNASSVIDIAAYVAFIDEGSTTSKEPSKQATTARESKEGSVVEKEPIFFLNFKINLIMIGKVHSAVFAYGFCHT